ncbi:MAG: hypothetical protein LLG04_09655 [Parachlamydia sp.]|nr:hypothetical protein [Parachlamydia sp.]
MNIEGNRTPPSGGSPEKEKTLSPRNLPLPTNPEAASEEKVRTIARRKSIISTQSIGIKMAFYHGRVERVKQVQERVAQMQKETASPDQINREKETLERETASLKQSLQEFIGNVKELEKVIDEEPHTAVEIIQISDTYFKEWNYEAANTLLQSCPEATIAKLVKAYLHKEVNDTKEPNTLFRSTGTTLGHLVGLYQNKHLNAYLQKRLDQILSKCIFHKRVGSIGTKESGLALRFVNQTKAKEQTLRLISKLKNHLQKSRLPEPLRNLYRTAYAEVENKHHGIGLGRIASLFFLQVINPAISQGTKHCHLGEIEYGEKDEGNAVVIAKVLQSIVNHSCPTGELYAEINAAFIDKEQVKVEEIARLLLI